MSGHSKWASIKHKKGATDAKRGKLFSKLIREISVAARLGGSDPSSNPRLRTVLDKARAANMPNDNVDRAIKKGTGQLEGGAAYEEVCFEGYGPGGVAILIQTLTDNRNRTVADIRHLLNKGGGSLGESGCVAWMFKKRGIITFDKAVSEELLMSVSLDAGAEDIRDDEETYAVLTSPAQLESVKEACLKKDLRPLEATITMVPENTIKVEGDDAAKLLKLLEALEDHEDTQSVSANFDIDAKTMETLVS